MKSILVEFARLKTLDRGTLREGDDYLCIAEQLPVRQVTMNIDQYEFNGFLKDLRYETASEDKRQDALTILSNKSTELMDCAVDDDGSLGAVLNRCTEELQQIDFVANAAELSAIPFEAALASDRKPLFLSRGGVVLTRRVRDSLAERTPIWPDSPKVLFAWSAAGGEVPQCEHREALLDALDPWLPAKKTEWENVFVEICNAKLKGIKSAVDAAAKSGAGFTHVHLLAHGTPVKEDNDHRFGIALNHPADGVDAVEPGDLADALAAIRASSVVVTLAACDLGNQTDSINPKKSVAHELHVSGIPVVIASQLPLTIEGSNILVKRFYRDLLSGIDVRAALHAARVELYDSQSVAGHDWVSLVGYVRLNEGYNDFLDHLSEERKLQSRLKSLASLRAKAEELAAAGADREKFEQVRSALQREIENLANLAAKTRDGAALDENLGLLGSAEKRLSELCFHHFGDKQGLQASRAALERSRNWYRRAFHDNPSHHWSGVQYLVLDAALEGRINERDWKTAYYAAQVDRCREDEYWALGSLAELALLAPIINANTDASAEAYLAEMRERVTALAEPPAYDPFSSTKQQLLRYTDWWRQDVGFFPDAPDLATEAKRLASTL